MTAIDKLCQFLDGRNEEYERRGNSGCLSYHEWVGWYFNLTDRAYFYEYSDGSTKLVTYRYDYNPTPEQAIAATLGAAITGETSDGYHTFNELYHHRAILFSVIVRDHKELAWKSKAHNDGTMYDGMFIVGIETPQGQATYHYDIDPYWDMFECKELDRAPEWDGHTPDDAIARIATLGDADATVGRQLDARLSNCTNGERTSDELGRGTCRVMTIGEFNGEGTEYYDVCSNCGYEFDDDPLNYCPNCGRGLVVDE